MANPGPALLWEMLRDTETRLKVFDELIERYPDCEQTILREWRLVRPSLYVTLGAAYGGALKNEGPWPDLQALARAMKKVLPAELLAEVVAHLDPLTPFVEFLRRKDLEQL